MPWWVWVAAALVLAGAEMFTPGFGVLWFGAGAAAAAAASAVGLSAPWQAAVFGAVGLSLLAATRPFMRALSPVETPTNTDALIGQEGIAEDDFGVPGRPAGYVRLGAERWRATSGVPVPQGARVAVRGVSGVTLHVEPVDKPGR